jgi:VCBS repeat-containing protein
MDDTYSVNANTALNQAAPGLLSNDTDSEGATLTAQLVSAPSHGSLTLNADGSFVYTPVANYVGSDSFTYMANDGTTNSNVATVSITVVQTPIFSTLSISPTSVTGGTTSQGTVTLSGPAPSGGLVVTLSSDSSAATVPASVTIERVAAAALPTLSPPLR